MNTELHSEITKLVPTLPGWATVRKALTLASIVTAIRPSIVVEIGVFAGRSALPMAMALQSNGHGLLLAIDPWKPSESVRNQTQEHVDFWSHAEYHDSAKLKFHTMTSALGLADFVSVNESASDDVDPPANADLVHIDGNHSAQAIRDANRFGSRVRNGGFCVLDDISWVAKDGCGPANAVQVLLDLGFRELYRCCLKPQTDDDWAVFQRMTR